MSKRNTILLIVEILVMGGIFTAFVAPVFSPSDQTAQVER